MHREWAEMTTYLGHGAAEKLAPRGPSLTCPLFHVVGAVPAAPVPIGLRADEVFTRQHQWSTER
jgi:hypothetical protein